MEGKEMPPSLPALMAACILARLSSGFLPVFRHSFLKVPSQSYRWTAGQGGGQHPNALATGQATS